MSRLIYEHIIEANSFLSKYNLKLSLKDACGCSCMQLKNIDGTNINNIIDKKIYSEINTHFLKYKLKITYSNNKEYLFAENI